VNVMVRVLIVGAGAVGIVYGYHLFKGGVDISFLVKPNHVSKLAKGINLFDLSLPKSQRKRVLFREFTLYTDPTITTRELFDQIWICTDSTALLDSDFFSALLSKVDPSKTVLVNSTPEFDDDELLLSYYKSKDRLIHTTISFQSWQAPLPDEKIHPTLLFLSTRPNYCWTSYSTSTRFTRYCLLSCPFFICAF